MTWRGMNWMLKTHQLQHAEPQGSCHMPGRLKCILIAAVCFELLQFAVICSCSYVLGHCQGGQVYHVWL